jgi:hypothetical protein
VKAHTPQYRGQDDDLPAEFWDRPNRVTDARERVRAEAASLGFEVTGAEIQKFAILLLALEDDGGA